MKFKTVNGNGGIIKPDTLVNPLVGILKERKSGKDSPIYVIEDLDGKIHRIQGCSHLDKKLSGVHEGTTVLIQFDRRVNTSRGHQMVIMLVQFAVPDENGDENQGVVHPEFHVDYSKSIIAEIPKPISMPISEKGDERSVAVDVLARFRIPKS